MNSVTYVGIDVAKRTLDVALGPDGPSRTLAYDADGLRRLDELLAEAGRPFVCLEGTGGYERPLMRHLAGRGVPRRRHRLDRRRVARRRHRRQRGRRQLA